MEQLLRGQIWVITRIMKVKGAATTLDISLIPALWWKEAWSRGQVLHHRSDSVCLCPDLEHGKDTDLMEKEIFRIEGNNNAEPKKPARALTDREHLWLVEPSRMADCVSRNKDTGAEVVETTLAGKEVLQTESRPQIASPNSAGTEPNRFQILVRTPMGNTILIWTHATDRAIDLKNNIANQIGYPAGEQNLVTGGRSLQDHRTLKEYNIKPGSTIFLNMRLRGGATTSKTTEGGSGSKSNHNPAQHQQYRSEGASYKHILQSGKAPPTVPKQAGTKPSPYIVEQLQHTPELTIDTTKAEGM